MDQLALDMEKILNNKKQEMQKMGMKMEISTVMTTIKEKLKDEIWKMCQVREEIKGQGSGGLGTSCGS